jgi:hypothetical protein
MPKTCMYYTHYMSSYIPKLSHAQNMYVLYPLYVILYYEFSLLHIFSLVLQPWMSAYIRKTDGVYISVPKNDYYMHDKTLRFTESMV